MRSPVAELLADVGRAFDAMGVDWYLFGAQAAIVYGVARLTADVDVTARPPDNSNATALLTVLERHGFERRFGDANFVAQTRVLPVAHVASGLPVDIVLAGPGLEEEFLSRAVVHDIDGVRVPVLEVSDLIVLKILAGRPKDLEDAVTLLQVQAGSIDENRVEAVLRMLEGALGQSDLLTTFNRCRQEARG